MVIKEVKSKRSFWDILAWIAFVIFFTYLLLKTLNILNSPPIADITAFASAAFFIGRYAQKIDTCVQRLESVEYKLEIHVGDKRTHSHA
ncbi:MAG: hypothetical protein AABY07_06660 [Nanoarchaeota archaeon]